MRILIISILIACLAAGCKSTKTQSNEASDANLEARSTDRDSRPERGGKRGARPSVEEVFKMDADGNGLLSKSEVGESPLARNFDNIDSNDDGFISKEEFENAPKPKRGQRPRKNN